MAIKDVKAYFYTVLSQYIEEKQNLADFEEALKEGNITQDQMQEALDIVADLETNYHRLAYIMYLLDMPNRKDKKSNYVKQYKPIVDELERLGADPESIKAENSDALVHFKATLKSMKKSEQ
jgi:benzoyl-CoA reductase/2-hydroxyglutaryl-CoA dehydratase subunit BcrC/BadD/HgdB